MNWISRKLQSNYDTWIGRLEIRIPTLYILFYYQQFTGH